MTSTSGFSSEDAKTLQKELPIALEQHGANNKSKAQYVKFISDHVIGSSNPKFFSMQPRVKDHNNVEAWKAAYYIILNFFDEFNLNYTKEVLLNELKQNKIQKPPLPSMPEDSKTDNLDEIFSFESVFEVSNINVFSDNVEIFVKEHPKDVEANQSAGSANHASPPASQKAENKPTSNPNINDEEDGEIEIIDDFNEYSGTEVNVQGTKEEEKESKKDDDNPEILDINDFTESEGENENKQDDIEDFNADEIDEVFDEADEQKQANNESDARNSNMSMSFNSDQFEMNFEDE